MMHSNKCSHGILITQCLVSPVRGEGMRRVSGFTAFLHLNSITCTQHTTPLYLISFVVCLFTHTVPKGPSCGHIVVFAILDYTKPVILFIPNCFQICHKKVDRNFEAVYNELTSFKDVASLMKANMDVSADIFRHTVLNKLPLGVKTLMRVYFLVYCTCQGGLSGYLAERQAQHTNTFKYTCMHAHTHLAGWCTWCLMLLVERCQTH